MMTKDEGCGFREGFPYTLIEEYYSRRNRVALVLPEGVDKCCRLLVIKEHASARMAECEYNNLLDLSAAGVPVPRPLDLNGHTICLQHLEGPLLSDIIEKELLPRSHWAKKLALWYYKFHRSKVNGQADILRTDNNLRNFLYQDREFYGLDFECISQGSPAEDIGQVCAFILADRPTFTGEKKAAAAELVQHYLSLNGSITREEVENEAFRELERMAVRRKKERDRINSFISSESLGKGLFFYY